MAGKYQPAITNLSVIRQSSLWFNNFLDVEILADLLKTLSSADVLAPILCTNIAIRNLFIYFSDVVVIRLVKKPVYLNYWPGIRVPVKIWMGS